MKFQLNRCQPYVDTLPTELTVLLWLFKNTCNLKYLSGVNWVDSLVSTNLTKMILGIDENCLNHRQEIHGVFEGIGLQSTKKWNGAGSRFSRLSRRSDGHGFVPDDSVEEEHHCRNYNYSQIPKSPKKNGLYYLPPATMPQAAVELKRVPKRNRCGCE